MYPTVAMAGTVNSQAFPPSRDGAVSILTWNCLADCYFKKHPEIDYAHVIDRDSFDWTLRFTRLIEVITASGADVVCLQEIMFAAYETDFVPALAKHGYDGCMQNDRKRGANHPQGVATFWKRSAFCLAGECHRTRAMATVLLDQDQRRLALVNCHLEGNPLEAVARVKQLQTTLHELSRKHEHHALVVCGDFNCALGQSACSAYLAFGAVPRGQVAAHTYTIKAMDLLVECAA